MKTIALTFVCLFVALTGFAQANDYAEAMKTGLQAMKTAQSPADWQQIANQFDRIAAAETNKWEPLYYSAFSNIMQSFKEEKSENKDKMVDAAEKSLEKALAIAPNESELIVLKAFAYQARLSISPMSRGRDYTPKVYAELEKAKAINGENPRIYFLMGQNLFNTPKFFGGGADKAKPQFELAKTKYDNFKPANEFAPNWGKESNDKLLAKCNE